MELISRKDAKSLGLKYYFTNKPCKHGHISKRIVGNGYCNECSKIQSKKYREANQEKHLQSIRDWRSKNKEHIKKYNLSRRDSYLAWAKENKSKLRANRMNYKRRNPMLVFLRRTLERLERYVNAHEYEQILGYTQEEFIEHIESQFKPGMSWENRSEWHIDHIRPIKSFLDEGVSDVSVINALSNLQPLWAEENRSKGSKY